MSGPDEAAAVARPKQFPCGQCGARLKYQPGTTVLRCGYCGFENEITQTEADIEELDYRAHLAKLAEAEPVEERSILKCASCRAEVQPAAHVTSTQCPFCNADLVTVDEHRRLIRPRLLLPFHVRREHAWKAYRDWVTSRWFAPTKLKRYARQEGRLQGMYCPFWTYDSTTTTAYTGQRGVHYYVTTGSGKSRRRVRKTRWTPVRGVVANSFDDVLVVASRSLPNKYADQIEPWDLQNLTAYNEDYLSGFGAESYQVTLEEGFDVAAERMAQVIRSTICGDIGGDTQQISSMDVHYDTITFKHILLPIWTSAFRYGNKVYRFLINARTGEVQGERPYSWVKIMFAVLGGLLAVAVIAAIVAAVQ